MSKCPKCCPADYLTKFWIRESKASLAYVGKDMDREARKSMFDKTRAEVKEFGHAKSLAPWDVFVAWVETLVEAYNNRPHSSLPEIRDPATGKKRHMTPNEQWAALAPEADIIMEEETVLEDLFRAYGVNKVNRCVVKVLGNEYSNKAMTLYHGQEVILGYDIHDPSIVWIRDSDGRPFCTATLNAHVTPYFPKSVVEKARDKRAKSRLERLERPEEGDVARLLAAWDVPGKVRELCHWISRQPGALHVLRSILRIALLLAENEGQDLAESHVKAAWSDLRGAA